MKAKTIIRQIDQLPIRVTDDYERCAILIARSAPQDFLAFNAINGNGRTKLVYLRHQAILSVEQA